MLYQKRWLALMLLVVLGLALGGCVVVTPAAPPAQEAAPAEAQPAAPAEAEAMPAETGAEPVQVALLLPGPITDGGWSQLAYEGLQALGNEEGFEVAFSENIAQADIPEVTRGYADDGFDLLIGHGFEFGSAFIEIAPEYPDQFFFATTFKPQENIPANTQYVDAAYFDAAYAAGALAALLSDSRVVGFVGGGDNPTQRGMMNAFISAAEATVEGATGLGVVTGDYNDAAKGREAAATMIGNGADVIWHAADVTGLGAIEGAVASGAKVLGCYSDQTEIAPDAMGASLVMDLANMVQKLGHDVRDGAFAAGTEWQPSVDQMWHWSFNDGESDHNPAVIPDELWQNYLAIWNDLAAGNIDVPVVTD
jgi:basic membrane protein A